MLVGNQYELGLKIIAALPEFSQAAERIKLGEKTCVVICLLPVPWTA